MLALHDRSSHSEILLFKVTSFDLYTHRSRCHLVSNYKLLTIKYRANQIIAWEPTRIELTFRVGLSESYDMYLTSVGLQDSIIGILNFRIVCILPKGCNFVASP